MNSRKDLYHLLLLVNQKADKISDRLEMVEKEFDTLKAQHLNLLNAFVEHVPDYTDDPQPKE